MLDTSIEDNVTCQFYVTKPKEKEVELDCINI